VHLASRITKRPIFMYIDTMLLLTRRNKKFDAIRTRYRWQDDSETVDLKMWNCNGAVRGDFFSLISSTGPHRTVAFPWPHELQHTPYTQISNWDSRICPRMRSLYVANTLSHIRKADRLVRSGSEFISCVSSTGNRTCVNRVVCCAPGTEIYISAG
jgi:hypothetical protein